jgi:hypothetical protein
MSPGESIPCEECGAQTYSAQPTCNRGEPDQGMCEPRSEQRPAAGPQFTKWWMTPDARTGHPPSACLDLGSALRAWAAARSGNAATVEPEPKSGLAAFAEMLTSTDPDVVAEVERRLRLADTSRRRPQVTLPPPDKTPGEPVHVPGGHFEQIGTGWLEGVNSKYHPHRGGIASAGEPLYRFVATVRAEPPAPEHSAAPSSARRDTLCADDIEKLRQAVSWMGESTPESHEECGIHSLTLMRRLIAATLAGRDFAYAENAASGESRPLPDREIGLAINKLRDTAVQFHHTQQLRSRLQDVVLPLIARARAHSPGKD